MYPGIQERRNLPEAFDRVRTLMAQSIIALHSMGPEDGFSLGRIGREGAFDTYSETRRQVEDEIHQRHRERYLDLVDANLAIGFASPRSRNRLRQGS